MNYRREIDGLGAVAVVPVILFHAGFQAFSGGFVGVDVFFVISGYLITSIILTEKQAGTFTLLGFYERRVRRILPALFVVMLACLPFAWFWMLPGDLRDFSRSLRYVSLFSSNILFLKQSGYFDTAVELKPLLHTWSLAVEEQYYVVFPVLLLLIWRLGKRWILGIFAVMAVMSLAAAQWGSFYQPAATFYLLPTRGWEILLGVFIAFYLFTQERSQVASKYAAQIVSIVGVLLIAYAVLAFDKSTPFPSLYALVPTVGAGCIILFATPQTYVGQLLGSRLLVGIGLISYSAYLWHQPLFAFARHRSVSELGTQALVALSFVAFALAYASWRYVEKPFRAHGRIGRKAVCVTALLASVFFISVGVYGKYKDGFVDRLSAEEKEVYSYIRYNDSESDKEGDCFLWPDQTYRDFPPACGAAHNSAPTVFIWGDSHASALARGWRVIQPSVIEYTASGCPPIMDMVVSWRPHCKEVNDFVMREIERIKPEEIVLHANWLLYEQHNPIVHLAKTIDAIRSASSSSKVSILGGVPQWPPSLPVVMLRRHIILDKEQYWQNSSVSDLEAQDKRLRLVADAKGVSYRSAIEHLCKGGSCQIVVKADDRFQPTAHDYGHLTKAGAVLLLTKLSAQRSVEISR